MDHVYRIRIRGRTGLLHDAPSSRLKDSPMRSITPSAARGVLEAILWKPAIQWDVRIDPSARSAPASFS